MSHLYGDERPEYVGRRIDTDEQATILLDRVAAYLTEGNTQLAHRSLDRAYTLLVAQADKASTISVIRTLTLGGQLCNTADAALIFYRGAQEVIREKGLRRRARGRRTPEVRSLLAQHDRTLSAARRCVDRERADRFLDELLANYAIAAG